MNPSPLLTKVAEVLTEHLKGLTAEERKSLSHECLCCVIADVDTTIPDAVLEVLNMLEN